MIGYFTALTAYFWILVQDDGAGSSTTPLPFDLGVFGVAGVTVSILLFIVRTLWLDNKELRGEIHTIQTVAIERVADIASKGSLQLQESAKTLQATTVMMGQISSQPGVSSEQLAELNFNLRTLRELKERHG
jgi:hypothetical protein